MPSVLGTTSTSLGLGRKTTWLSLVKHHDLGLNNITYVSKLTYVTEITLVA